MPAANPRAMEKARTLPADVIVFDLEDAVAPDAKERAREQAVAAVRRGEYGAEPCIRERARRRGIRTSWPPRALRMRCSSRRSSRRAVVDVQAELVDAGASDEMAIWYAETPRGIPDATPLPPPHRGSRRW